MERYDYREEMKKDILRYIDECRDKSDGIITDEERDSLYDDMFISDDVTGNASGSYTYNAWKAEEYVAHNLDLLGQALDEFDIDGNTLRKKMSGEWADCTIRCYLLGQVIGDVIEEYNNSIEEEE